MSRITALDRRSPSRGSPVIKTTLTSPDCRIMGISLRVAGGIRPNLYKIWIRHPNTTKRF